MKMFEGKIVSDKMEKAASVYIQRVYRHPKYGKILKKGKKVHCRNEIGAKTGDLVKIVSIAPLSKTINFKIVEIINKENIKKDKKK